MVFIGNINTGSRATGSFFIKGNCYTTGNLVVAGNLLADFWTVTRGLDVAGNLNILGNFTIDGNVSFTSTEDVHSTMAGALHVAGGLSIRKNIAIGGNILAYGDLSFISGSDSISSTTGALKLTGGLGVAKNVNVGDTLKVFKSLILPVGTTLERATFPRQGELRFNTDYNDCEVYDINNNWRGVFDAEDEDKNTKISIADNIDDNIIRFYTEGNQRVVMGNNADSGYIGIGLGYNNPRSTLDILGNFSVSSNAYFNTGIIFGNSINSGNGIEGSIRYSGLDLEGYINSNWVSLTNPQDVLSFHTELPFVTYQFHVSQVTQTVRNGNRALGNPNEESNMFGHLYYLKYQLLNKNIIFDKLELAIDDESSRNANLSFTIYIYIDDVLQNTQIITNTKDSLVPILQTISDLKVFGGQRISFTAKANDLASEDAELFITMHGSYTPVEINISGNLHHVFNNNITFRQNLTVADNLNVLSNLNIIGGALKLGYVEDALDGRVRFTKNDFEGCVKGNWVSLTRAQDIATFSTILPYKSEQFQLSNTELAYKYSTRALGVNNVIFMGSYYEFKYQTMREGISFKNIEVILDEGSIDAVNALEFTLIIEVNNVSTKTVTLSFAAGEYAKVVSIGSTLLTVEDDIISIKLKGNNSYSVNLDIIFCLLGENHVRNITIDSNTSIVYNSNFTVNSDIFINGNAIFGGNLICNESVYLNNGVIIGTTSENLEGSIRYNSDLATFEGYNGLWTKLGGGGGDGIQDVDLDTRITSEESTDEDIIRFYTQNEQRMMISNRNNSGYIGIGIGYNNPQSTLDIFGNLSVSGNAYFNSGLILGNNTQDIEGTIRYMNDDFQGYILGNWNSLINSTSYATINTTIPYKSSQFEFRKTTELYKYANRATGMHAEDVNEFAMAFIYKYERIHTPVVFNKLEIIQDNQSLVYNNHIFTLKIEVNDIVVHTETFTFIIDEFKSKLITLSSTITVVEDDVISFKLKADNTDSIHADLLLYLIGDSKVQTLEINGNLNMIMKNAITASENFTINKNLNVLGNVNITEKLIVARNCVFNNDVGIGIEPLYQLHLSTDSAAKPSTNTWTISSDSRIKTNIQKTTKEELYNIAKNFDVKRYNFKDTYRNAHKLQDKSYLGIIADEVNEYMPCCVNKYNLKYKIGEDAEKKNIYEEINDCLNYNGSELQFALFGCIPYLIKENEELKHRIDLLEKKNILN